MNTQLAPNTINLLGIREKVMLAHSSANRTGQSIFMRAITAAEEDKIDKRSDKSNVYMYGDIDLSNSDDLKHISHYNIVNDNYKGMIYNNFNYDKGIYKLVDGEVKWHASIDPIAWFKFNYCLIGKPPKIVVYNHIFGELWRR